MTTGISARAAATRVGCTHSAVNLAVKTGRIPKLSDGSLAPEAVDIWHAGRRTPRGGARRIPATSNQDSLTLNGRRQPTERGQVVAESVLLGELAAELAAALCRVIPAATARQIVAQLDWTAAAAQAAAWRAERGRPAP